MHSFKDCKGREWEISLTLGSAMAVRDAIGVDLLSPEQGDPPLLTRLGTDELLLGQVIAALLAKQIEASQYDAPDVLDAFDGETLGKAHTAFYEELRGLFQSRGRKDRATAVEKQMAMLDAAIEAVSARLDAVNVDAAVAGAMSGESPEPSASTLET